MIIIARLIHSYLTLLILVALTGVLLCARLQGQGIKSSVDIRKAREFFINGTTLQIQGNRQAEAILEFQQALRYDSSAATLTAIARSYLELRKLDLSMEYADVAIERDSSSRDTWELIAEIEVMRGNYDHGIAAYERILSLGPSRRQLYTLGCLYEPRNAAKAIDMFERLCQMEPDESLLLRLADLYERRRDLKGVQRSLERARQLDPIDPQIAARTCELYVGQAMFPELLVLLSSWKERDVDLDKSARVWGTTLSTLIEDTLVVGMYHDEITNILDGAEESFKQVWPVMALAGTLSIRMSDTARAARFFQLTVANVSSTPESLIEISRIYLMSGYAGSAHEYLLKGQIRYPNDIRFLFLLGGTSLELGNDVQAMDYYYKVLAMDASVVDAWVQIGLLYDKRNESNNSDLAYEQALKLDPDHSLANNNYSYSLATRNISLDRARIMSWKALQSEPNNAAFLDTHAWVLFLSGDVDRARGFIERAIAVGGNATHYEHYGDILEALNDVNGSIRAWQASLSRDPTRSSIQMKLDKYR